jgi:Rieske Fe-S protein
MKNDKFLAALLATILVLQTAMAASGSVVPKSAPVEQSAKAAALRRKVLKVPPQSMVVVKLKNKEQLRGRLTQPATPEAGSCLNGGSAPVEQEVSQCAR